MPQMSINTNYNLYEAQFTDPDHSISEQAVITIVQCVQGFVNVAEA